MVILTNATLARSNSALLDDGDYTETGWGCFKMIFNVNFTIVFKTFEYMVMSWDRNAGRGHSVKNDNSSIERVEEFKYLGTTLTDQNSVEKEVKSRLQSGNACYHSVQNLFSSSLLSKNVTINFASCFVWV